MVNIPNKFVLLSAIAAATLVIPGTLGPLAFEEAYADHRGNSQDNEQSARAIQNAGDNLVNAQVAVPANVNVQVTDVNACIIVDECD